MSNSFDSVEQEKQDNTIYSTCEIRVSRVNETVAKTSRIEKAEQAVQYWKDTITNSTWYDSEKEMLVVLLMDTRSRIIGHSLVSLGSLNESIAHPREIFRPAIAAAAYCIVLMHNHPSGDPSPSEGDRRLTRRLSEAATVLLIPLTDHVVVGKVSADHEEYFSFREAGLI